MKSTAEIVRQAQAGDVKAFEALVRQFQDMAVGGLPTYWGNWLKKPVIWRRATFTALAL